MYYPIQPVYQEIWQTYGQTAPTPALIAQHKGKIATEDRTDLTEADKMKARRLQETKAKNLAVNMAYDELEGEITESKQFMKEYLKTVHGHFINETDFESSSSDVSAKGETNYKAFVNQYIKYKYAPAVEDYDEARYFT